MIRRDISKKKAKKLRLKEGEAVLDDLEPCRLRISPAIRHKERCPKGFAAYMP